MKVMAQHGNTLQSETSWQVILIEGLIALGRLGRRHCLTQLAIPVSGRHDHVAS